MYLPGASPVPFTQTARLAGRAHSIMAANSGGKLLVWRGVTPEPLEETSWFATFVMNDHTSEAGRSTWMSVLTCTDPPPPPLKVELLSGGWVAPQVAEMGSGRVEVHHNLVALGKQVADLHL